MEQANTGAKPAQRTFRHWDLTVTPKLTSYAGDQAFGECTERVYARSRDEAIKQVRRARRDADGRHAVPVSYRATEAA